MKIIMIARLFSPHRGGVEKHVEEIAKLVTQAGNEVTVITGQSDPALAYKSRLLNDHGEESVYIRRISTLYVSNESSFLNKLRERVHIWLWMFYNLKLFLAADIVHIHDVFWWYWPFRILF